MHVLSSPAGTDRDGQHREATALPGEPLQWRHLPAEQPPNSQKTGGRYFQGWVPKGSLMPQGARARCESEVRQLRRSAGASSSGRPGSESEAWRVEATPSRAPYGLSAQQPSRYFRGVNYLGDMT